MKNRACLFYALLLSIINPYVFAQDIVGKTTGGEYEIAGHGVIHMPGSILDAACAIDTESEDQTVNLHLSSIGKIVTFGYANSEDLVIKLVHCTKSSSEGGKEWKSVTATFNGVVDEYDKNLFALHGSIRGVGIRIEDEKNNLIIPGKTVVSNSIPLDTAEFRGRVILVADSNKIERGVGRSTIQLRLNYN